MMTPEEHEALDGELHALDTIAAALQELVAHTKHQFAELATGALSARTLLERQQGCTEQLRRIGETVLMRRAEIARRAANAETPTTLQ